MTPRSTAATVLVLVLFGAGYAIAVTGKRPRPQTTGVTDAAPRALAVERVGVEAELGRGTPARLRPTRPRRRATTSVAAPVPVAPATVQPPAVPAVTPAPAAPAPAAPALAPPPPPPAPAPPVSRRARPHRSPKPPRAPKRQLPWYVGAVFDEAG